MGNRGSHKDFGDDTHSQDPERGTIADCGGPSESFTQRLEAEAWEQQRPFAFHSVDFETRDTAAFTQRPILAICLVICF